MSRTPGGRFIVPDPGFVARALVHAAAAPRIAEARQEAKAEAEAEARGEALYVNIVGHEAVQRPALPSSSRDTPVLVEEQQGWSG